MKARQSTINLTLKPDLQYPNNTLSQFYSILPEELNGPLEQVALTEFIYPVNYLVNLGFLNIQMPGYMEFNKNKDSFKIDENLFKDIENYLISFETEYNLFLSNENEEESFLKIEEIVNKIDQFFDYYHHLLKQHTHLEPKLKFVEISNLFNEFFQSNKNIHEQTQYSTSLSEQFFNKVFFSYQEILNRQNIFDLEEKIIKKIEIRGNDRMNQKELLYCFYSELKFLCTNRENVLILKPSVHIVNSDLDYLVTINDNQIIFNKKIQNVKIKNFFIYTDIISDSLFYDKKDSILRVIPTKGKYDDQIYNTFTLPHFETINKTRISKIWIKITDQEGEPVQFQSGPILLKLQIKKK